MKTEIARFEQEAAALKGSLQRGSKAGSKAKDKLTLLQGDYARLEGAEGAVVSLLRFGRP
jgi:hypothetical protein